MQARIENIESKKLLGKRLRMSFSNNRTFELWNGFMPLRNQIKNNISTELISLQVYDSLPDFSDFNPEMQFEKWAAVVVSSFDQIPEGMEAFLVPGGLYAVFQYKGAASEAKSTFRYIFGTWLPNSGYILDQRPHFEILGAKYKNESPDSEEEIWIPIKKQDNA